MLQKNKNKYKIYIKENHDDHSFNSQSNTFGNIATISMSFVNSFGKIFKKTKFSMLELRKKKKKIHCYVINFIP